MDNHSKLRKKIFKRIYSLVGNILPISNSKLNLGQKLIRYFLAKQFVCKIGKNVNIEKGAIISESLSIGDNSGVGRRCELYGKVTIGNNVLMGPEVIVYTVNHGCHKKDKLILEQGFMDCAPVTIGNDVWIGRRVIILPGVHIGDGAVVGAGAVVAKDIPPYSFAVGNPIQIKGQRL